TMHLPRSLLRAIGAPLSIAILGIAASVAAQVAVATLVRGPYLQMLSPQGVTVLWRTAAPAACALAIRPLDGPGRVVDGGAGIECAIDVDGLEPGTQYAYTPLADGVPLDAESVFRTDDPARPFTFLVLG